MLVSCNGNNYVLERASDVLAYARGHVETNTWLSSETHIRQFIVEEQLKYKNVLGID